MDTCEYCVCVRACVHTNMNTDTHARALYKTMTSQTTNQHCLLHRREEWIMVPGTFCWNSRSKNLVRIHSSYPRKKEIYFGSLRHEFREELEKWLHMRWTPHPHVNTWIIEEELFYIKYFTNGRLCIFLNTSSFVSNLTFDLKLSWGLFEARETCLWLEYKYLCRIPRSPVLRLESLLSLPLIRTQNLRIFQWKQLTEWWPDRMLLYDIVSTLLFLKVKEIIYWDRRFESHSRHGCLSSSFRAVLSCVGRGLPMPPPQGPGSPTSVEKHGSETLRRSGLGCTRTTEPQWQKERKSGELEWIGQDPTVVSLNGHTVCHLKWLKKVTKYIFPTYATSRIRVKSVNNSLYLFSQTSDETLVEHNYLKNKYLIFLSFWPCLMCSVVTERQVKTKYVGGIKEGDPGSSVSIVSGYGAIEVRSPAEAKGFFPLASVSRPALGPTQPPVQWVPEVLSPGLKCGRGVTLTTHPHLVPRSRMSRSFTPPPQEPSWRVVGQL
jgi:hypothetical protein